MSTLGGIFSAVSGMHRRIIMKLITVTHYHIHVIPMTFEGRGFKAQGHGTSPAVDGLRSRTI